MHGELDRGGFYSDANAVRKKMSDGLVTSIWAEVDTAKGPQEWGRVFIYYGEQGVRETLWASDRVYLAEYTLWMHRDTANMGIASLNELLKMKLPDGSRVLSPSAINHAELLAEELDVIDKEDQPIYPQSYLKALSVKLAEANSIINKILTGGEVQ